MCWDSTWSFDELARMLLLNSDEESKLSPEIFLTANEQEIKMANARYKCPSAQKYLREYVKATPDKMFLDLATNPDFTKRTELTSGALMTLTTNTKIWSNPQHFFVQHVQSDRKSMCN